MRIIPALVFALWGVSAVADVPTMREGWVVVRTDLDYGTLLDRTKEAIGDSPLALVTQAGPTETARNRGITIPGNRVLGVFNNRYAVSVIRLSEAAMIEAPIRMYVTENEDGTATLSYKTPTQVFSAYFDEGGEPLEAIASELDLEFLTIAQSATRSDQ